MRNKSLHGFLLITSLYALLIPMVLIFAFVVYLKDGMCTISFGYFLLALALIRYCYLRFKILKEREE